MSRRPTSVLLIACAAALGVAACGSSGSGDSGGVASQSASQIVTTSSNALKSVSSVHLVGNISEGSAGKIALDLRLVPGKGAIGSMNEGGSAVKLVIIGQQIYLNAGSSFWKQAGGAAAVRELTGKWIKGPSAEFGGLANELSINTLLKGLLKDHGGLSKGSTATVDGHKVIAVKDNSRGGTLYVATTGKPYPIEVSESGSGGGKLSFSEFNAQVSLTPPPGAKTPQQLTK